MTDAAVVADEPTLFPSLVKLAPTSVYELLSIGYDVSTGVKTLGLYASLEGAKNGAPAYKNKWGAVDVLWEEGTGNKEFFAELGDAGVTLYITKREVNP